MEVKKEREQAVGQTPNPSPVAYRPHHPQPPRSDRWHTCNSNSYDHNFKHIKNPPKKGIINPIHYFHGGGAAEERRAPPPVRALCFALARTARLLFLFQLRTCVCTPHVRVNIRRRKIPQPKKSIIPLLFCTYFTLFSYWPQGHLSYSDVIANLSI